MIKYWLVSGDTHLDFSRFYPLFDNEYGIQFEYPPEETAIIILGDSGLNFMLNEQDRIMKNKLSDTGYTWYLVRGNHEERPQNLGNVIQDFDNETQGLIWIEKDFPKIKYFQDGGTYNLGSWHTLVIGGAYSVDKWYRLGRCGIQKTSEENRDYIQKVAHWFYDEQLTNQEKENILNNVRGADFDLVLTHTCPEQWMPIDLFLPGIDQSTVDNSMEYFLSEVEANISYHLWLAGHYHTDRRLNSNAKILYEGIYDLADLMED